MSKIRILPEILSNKIAAGEVVERPASVVKELVENALDAGSTRIIIEVENGGRSLIRISDNGSGMSRDDAMLSLERYATSKIYKDEDLFSISTLGFRGEALPSIASVSRFVLETRNPESSTGTRIEVDGGKMKKVSETGAPPGTMVEVKQLFFNTPARRKFMKTAATEMGHIGDRTASIALGRPDVHFRLLHNGKIVKTWPGVSDPFDRAADVLDRETRDSLHKIEIENDFFSLSGWISSPGITRTSQRGIYVYVNGRFVRDRGIQHALFAGYTGRIMKGQFPLAVLFLSVPPDQVDVNVHPAKNEVRFFHQQEIHQAVSRKVSEVLKHADQPKWQGAEMIPPKPEIIAEEPAERLISIHESNISEALPEYVPPVFPIEKPAGSKAEIPLKQEEIWEKKAFGDLRIIGQFHRTYILCESEEGLVLIDQHAAHERIVFEKLKNRSSGEKQASQKLLIPETIDLSYREAEIFEKMLPDFKEMGLEAEHFGGNTFVIKSVPALISDRRVTPLIVEIIEKIAEIGSGAGLEKVLDECLILMACHGAVRAGQTLSKEQIQGLLNQLDKCGNPSRCPHGRPTWIKWTKSFLEKSFNRTGQ